MVEASNPTRRRLIAFIAAFIAAGALAMGPAGAQKPAEDENQKTPRKPAEDPQEWLEKGELEGRKEIKRTDLPKDHRKMTTRAKKAQVKQEIKKNATRKKVRHKKVKHKKTAREKVE